MRAARGWLSTRIHGGRRVAHVAPWAVLAVAWAAARRRCGGLGPTTRAGMRGAPVGANQTGE